MHWLDPFWSGADPVITGRVSAEPVPENFSGTMWSIGLRGGDCQGSPCPVYLQVTDAAVAWILQVASETGEAVEVEGEVAGEGLNGTPIVGVDRVRLPALISEVGESGITAEQLAATLSQAGYSGAEIRVWSQAAGLA